MKTVITVAAAGGLIATVAAPANAETTTHASEASGLTAAAPAPAAAAGPVTGVVEVGHALASIGYQPAAPKKAEPAVIEDVVVTTQRAEAEAKKKAAAEAAARAAEARQAEQARASRSTTRTTLTASTYASKAATNAPSGTQGGRSSHNWATRGQCTWGALDKWYQSEGYYPGGWTGNAMTWASGAANAGYTVTSTPRVRSIVVLQPGVHGSSSSAGHVGWVTAVNGNQVTIVEMNALAGPYNYNTRTLTHVGGMQYIYAP
jgi:surface antigen